MDIVRLLALSGSLRKVSYNTAALKALQALAPGHVRIEIGEIGGLPLFNPDREDESIPALRALESSLRQADGLIVASPEYAHGISGPMKNALDWLVGGMEFPHKPIMLVNTSPRASHAQAALKEVLTTMSGDVIDDAYTSVPLLGSGLGTQSIVEDPAIAGALLGGLSTFCRAIHARRQAATGIAHKANTA
ncbi:NAD(P)H-dependent FMN reductase [Marinobacter gudaonensis]|uniref:NAD(P)H-dependent FMN reductase n=1 Tax=Marinobacter gudaonensis TaxID=375760 RepID=A0A1I6G6U7_9GAMM|nr:NADPH-dependent FMN reductase [Marinobacter gudaonensis]SFR37909.1 NAD(P)H-dependent FMN reductase [Marinobacter gudaonensis]